MSSRSVVPRTVLPFLDHLADALASLRAHPVRSLAMSLGVILGVASVVATISLSATARLQVSEAFDSLRATRVDVELDPEGDLGGAPATQRTTFPTGATEAVMRLRGVVAAGIYVDIRSARIGIASNRLAAARISGEPRVVGLTPEALKAAEAVIQGNGISKAQVEDRTRIALVGDSVARQLGVLPGEPNRYIFIGGLPFLVGGIVTDGGRLPQLEAAVGIPLSAVPGEWLLGAPRRMLVHVDPGAAPAIARAIPYALDPAAPGAFHVGEPADPRLLRNLVDAQLANLGLWLALVSTLAGIIGIGSSTFGAVYERMEEFGLRRALGARPGQLRSLVLTECAVTGLAAGITGALIGLVTVVGASHLRGWVPTVDPKVFVAAPLLGLISGLVAGVIPAWKASRIEPVEALRR